MSDPTVKIILIINHDYLNWKLISANITFLLLDHP